MVGSKWPEFQEDECDAVQQVLRSGRVNYWTGEQCKSFEKEFAAYHGCEFAIALANGTLALELALYALGVGSGDEVIVPSRTFIATASAVVARGAIPVVADVDRDTGNITVETIGEVRSKKTKAIIPVHLGGWPCDMDVIMDYAHKHKIIVIEDCAQAHAAEYKGKKIGSWGDAAAFSFCQDKIMTTGGEGGMLLLHDVELFKKAWAYKDHGKGYDAVFNQKHPNGFRWLHECFGTNWRMTEMQAAIGRLQLQKLPAWSATRERNAMTLFTVFQNTDLLRMPMPITDDIHHAYYKFYVYITSSKLATGWSRQRIIDEITAQGVPCFSGSCSEIHLEKSFQEIGYKQKSHFHIAKELGETSLMFLVDHTLSELDMLYAANVAKEVFEHASV